MTSLNSSVGSKSTDLPLPRAVATPRNAAFSSRGASRGRAGTYEGSSGGAVRSFWISRLRPPPPPSSSSTHPPLPAPVSPSLPVTAEETGLTVPDAGSAQGGATVSTGESRTRPRSPLDDLDGSPFLVRRYLNLLRPNPAPPPRSFSSSRLLRHEAPGAVASSPHHPPLQQILQREERPQQKEPEADQDHRRAASAEHEVATAKREGKDRRDCRVAGFGPFQVSQKRPRLLLGKRHKQQKEKSQWKLEGSDHGGGCGTASSGLAQKGSYKAYLGDGCFPIFQKMVGFATMYEEGEVAEKDRKEELQAEVGVGEHHDEAGDQDYF